MQVLAISADPADKSREFAASYGIEFPLIHDKDLELAKQYAGVSTDGVAFPATYIVRPDGTVFLSKIGESMDDRIYTPKLVELIDQLRAELGADASGMPGVAARFERDNVVRLSLGLGVANLSDLAFALDVEAGYLRRFGDHVALGVEVSQLVRPNAKQFAAGLLPRVGTPLWQGVGELYLQLPIGYSRRLSVDSDANGLLLGAFVGTEMEMAPTFAVFAELGTQMSLHGLSSDSELDVAERVLLRLGAGWKF